MTFSIVLQRSQDMQCDGMESPANPPLIKIYSQYFLFFRFLLFCQNVAPAENLPYELITELSVLKHILYYLHVWPLTFVIFALYWKVNKI